MYGLVDIQRSLDDSAKNGIERAASLEKNREMANDQLDMQDDVNKKSSIGQGAGMGAMIGMAGGPAGMVAGAVIGAGAGYLVHEFF
jgi:hypothetical protein